MTGHSDRLQVLNDLIGASESGDHERFVAQFEEDAEIWQNLDQKTRTVDQFLRVLRFMDQVLQSRSYEDRRIELFDSGAVQQHVMKAQRVSDGKPVQLHACAVFRFGANGKISSMNEYLDSREAETFTSTT